MSLQLSRKEEKNKMKKLSTKLVVLLLAVALLFGCGVGGTIAWLMTATAPVVNTFTVGNINITLSETTGENYKLIPGSDIEKDPLVTVKAGSEDCYLFVKIDETESVDSNITTGTASADTYITYGVRSDWKKLGNENVNENVYWCKVDESANDQPFYVLSAGDGMANGHIHVKDTVTKAMLESDVASNLKLTFTAYAIQSANIEGNDEDAKAAAAWNYAKSATPPASGS